MKSIPDTQLLKQYAEAGDKVAFGQIVDRHLNAVYWYALRKVTPPDLARDIVQSVFVDLARKAKPLVAKLPENASLRAWLYRSTRCAALMLLRSERRRHTREKRATEQVNPASEEAPESDQVQPVLDEAMAELNNVDREALLLRYFQKRDLHAVGAALGVSDDAAQKRVSRALGRLRVCVKRHGVATTAVALTAAVSFKAATDDLSAPSYPAGLVPVKANELTPMVEQEYLRFIVCQNERLRRLIFVLSHDPSSGCSIPSGEDIEDVLL